MRIVGCGFNSDIACHVAGIGDCPANDTHRKTHVSTDELIPEKPENMIKEGRTVPRKGHTQKRDVLADPIYNNKVVTKLI